MKIRMGRKGFTLIELLIVIAVIAIIIGIVLPRFKGVKDEGNIIKAKGELRTLQTAVESFYIHNDSTYPAALADVTSANPQIVNAIPNDPYNPGNPYVYTRGGTNNQYYVIYSVGPNGNGSATIATVDGVPNQVQETNGASCIYVSNAAEDTQP